jgi:aminomethyltransferase
MAIRTPPLRAAHADEGARFTEFGGWDMPVQFDSIRVEHAAVRTAVGKFDVSHMGRIVVAGPDATTLMQRLTTNDVCELAPGEAQYAMITDEEGIVLDDTVVSRVSNHAGQQLCSPADRETVVEAADPTYLFVPNAGHDAQMLDRWRTHRDRWELDAAVVDATASSAMLAVQGPDAVALLSGVASDPAALADCDRFGLVEATIADVDCLASRTGYTGEDGFELLCAADTARPLWEALDCQPCGLGARDTLRIEMGFLLSGQDFDPETEPRTPYEAGVGFTVELDTEFVGRDALARVEREGIRETFVGVTLEDRGVPRSGYELTDIDGESIGHVTSGTMSPTLSEPIGLGYLPLEYADPGTPVEVVVRGEGKRASVTELPFLER